MDVDIDLLKEFFIDDYKLDIDIYIEIYSNSIYSNLKSCRIQNISNIRSKIFDAFIVDLCNKIGLREYITLIINNEITKEYDYIFFENTDLTFSEYISNNDYIANKITNNTYFTEIQIELSKFEYDKGWSFFDYMLSGQFDETYNLTKCAYKI